MLFISLQQSNKQHFNVINASGLVLKNFLDFHTHALYSTTSDWLISNSLANPRLYHYLNIELNLKRN